MTKRKFASDLRGLDVILESTGNIPSEQTIYKYLSGYISIPIELLSNIAEVLDITEQELFDTNSQTPMKLSQRQLNYRYYLNKEYNETSDIYSIYKEDKEELTFHHKQTIKDLISLLEFAPKDMITNIISNLEEIKEISIKNI